MTSQSFAPAHALDSRSSVDVLRTLSERALADPVLRVVLETVDGFAMLLDGHRQILAANEEMLRLLELEQTTTLIGCRPGEAFDCCNWQRGTGGCGTSAQCRHCGAVAALLAAQSSSSPVEGHCSVTRRIGGSDSRLHSADFRLRISPIRLAGERVYVLVMHDETTLKWRELQQRLFLHDLANIVGGITGWTELMVEAPSAELATELLGLVRQLAEGIETHRLLMRAETSELLVASTLIDFEWLFENLRRTFGTHECAKDRSLSFRCAAGLEELETDRQLLIRVLSNLIKNAFEASPPGATVTVTVASSNGTTSFEIHNEGVIGEPDLSQLLIRRFSTKGLGRGLGLYAVQILGEHCLGGSLDFASSETCGTCFRFKLPNHRPSRNC